MPKYTVIIFTPQELNHSSYIQTGLFELEKAGFIKVKVKLSTAKNPGRIIVEDKGRVTNNQQPHPKTSFYVLRENKSGKAVRFATDLYDFANQFSSAALEQCDFVFKRSFEGHYVNQLQERYKSKVHEMGLAFGVHSAFHREKMLFLTGLLLGNLRVNFKIDGFLFKRLRNTFKRQLRHWRFIKTTRQLQRFEVYDKSMENTILFQTRCFLWEEEGDVKQIHQQRYRIIKVLRQNFPDKFKGGFVPSKLVSENYGDALSNIPSEPQLYLNALKEARIVIYTRGLASSPAWKMAEYLSQAKIIIAERLTTELPVPLRHEKEVLFFDTETEMLEQIHRVLNDKALAETLAINARLYFEKHVHPMQNVKRILDYMIAAKFD